MFNTGFPPEWSTIKKLIWLAGAGIAGASYIWKTVTGALLHITDAIASPVKELSVAIEPLQAGSGDPSPTNVRPITGLTGCNIFRSGADTSYPTTYPISWQTEAGTVYGGTLTVNEDGSADLSVSWNKYEFDGSSDENWKISSNVRYWIAKSGIVYNRNSSAYIISDKLKSVSAGSLSNTMENCCYIGSDPFIGIVKSSIYNNLTNFRAFLAENPVTIIAKRTTPLTYHLDSVEQISTLAGENNIWADIDEEITLTYQAVPETAFSDNADTGMADYMTLTE